MTKPELALSLFATQNGHSPEKAAYLASRGHAGYTDLLKKSKDELTRLHSLGRNA